MRRYLILLLIMLFSVSMVTAQENTVAVPDLTGLNVPQAASILNTLGLSLGVEDAVPWTEASGLAEGSISGQSVEAGATVEAGSSIDVSVLRSSNMMLIYDDNDLTLVNLTINIADITGLRFAATEGTPASFAASRWGSNIRDNRCAQVWSIPRNQSKSLPECQDIQSWLTTNLTGEHFWTQANGVQQFSVIDNGIERVSCPAAPVGSQDAPLRCEFYAEGAGAAQDITTYLRLAYTTDSFAIINTSADLWMPTDRTPIINNVTGTATPLIIGDANLFQNPEMVADITRLAPQQCLLMTTNAPQNAMPPQSCSVIAQVDVPATTAFWLAEFQIDSANDGQIHNCPAATPGRLTLCIVSQ